MSVQHVRSHVLCFDSGILMVRFDARLAFYNIVWFVQRLEKFEREAIAAGDKLHTIIVDCEGQLQLSTQFEVLHFIRVTFSFVSKVFI